MVNRLMKWPITPTTAGMQYMLAHGNTPGPMQRPLLAGFITGAVASLPSIVELWFSGAIRNMSQSLHVDRVIIAATECALLIVAGAVYGRVFGRAANDTQGGWLFGIAFGFLLWMIGPGTLLQWILWRPLAIGTAAIGLFAGHLLYGLVLGLLFPWLHQALHRPLVETTGKRRTSAAKR